MYLSEGAVRSIAHYCLVAILAAGLLNLPALAAAEKPLAMIVQAQDAMLGNMKAANGTAVYPGDTVVTNLGGTMRLKVGSGQLYLLSSSAAALAENSSVVKAIVSRGTVGFSSSSADPLELETPLGIVRAANSQTAYGQVTITGPREMVVTAYHGALVIDYNGQFYAIPEGKSYRVSMDLDSASPSQPAAAPAQTSSGSGTTSPVNTHMRLKLAAVAVVATISWVLWNELTESQSDPK
jgi:hypothetical protein